MRRQGLLAAGLLTSATALCLLLNRQSGLNASEENEPRSFREAVSGDKVEDPVETEDGFRIRYFDATWEKVLRDLAEHEGLTLVMDKVPPGRFARRDSKRYDLETAVRILNSELEPQGFRLLVQKQFLIVLNLDKARTEYARPQLSQQRSKQNRAGARTPARTPAKAEDLFEDESTGSATRSLIRKASSQQVEEDDFGAANEMSDEDTPSRVRPASRAAASDDDDSMPELEPINPIRTVSKTTRSAKDEKPAATEMVSDEIALTNAKAADLARTIYVVFEKRAELQKEGLQGLPGFTVYDRAEDGTAKKDAAPVFRIGIDQNGNRLLIEASEAQLKHLRKLVSELDKPTAAGKEDESVRVVENNGISARTARQLNEQIHQLVSLADEKPTNPAVAESSGQIQTEDGDPAINLRGEVNVQAHAGSWHSDSERKRSRRRQGRRDHQASRNDERWFAARDSCSDPAERRFGSNVTLLTSVYEQLTELRQRTSNNNQKTAAFIPIVQPNALLIISSEIERESILKLASELDKPTAPELEFQVFPLKSAIASQVITALEGFYEEREGLGTSVRAIADVRTNSVIVQGR